MDTTATMNTTPGVTTPQVDSSAVAQTKPAVAATVAANVPSPVDTTGLTTSERLLGSLRVLLSQAHGKDDDTTKGVVDDVAQQVSSILDMHTTMSKKFKAQETELALVEAKLESAKKELVEPAMSELTHVLSMFSASQNECKEEPAVIGSDMFKWLNKNKDAIKGLGQHMRTNPHRVHTPKQLHGLASMPVVQASAVVSNKRHVDTMTQDAGLAKRRATMESMTHEQRRQLDTFKMNQPSGMHRLSQMTWTPGM